METKKQEFVYLERTSKTDKFDQRLIAHVVRLAEEGTPRKELTKVYGMSSETLGHWIAKYSSLLEKRKVYSTAEKRSVVRAVHAGMAIREALVVYNISSKSTIRSWMNIFSEGNTEISSSKPTEMSKKIKPETENAAVKALKIALDEANLKIKALDTMIDIAEEHLKIDIRKKSGARPSPK